MVTFGDILVQLFMGEILNISCYRYRELHFVIDVALSSTLRKSNALVNCTH